MGLKVPGKISFRVLCLIYAVHQGLHLLYSKIECCKIHHPSLSESRYKLKKSSETVVQLSILSLQSRCKEEICFELTETKMHIEALILISVPSVCTKIFKYRRYALNRSDKFR